MSSKCFTTGQNCCHPFVFLLSRMFIYKLRVSPGGIHATIPLFHWFCSCFLMVHMFYQCDIRILVFSHEKRKLFLLDFCWIPCGYSGVISCGFLVVFCRDSCVILAKILCVSCENLVYARGLPWGNTARQCPQEIAFGISEVTMGGPCKLLCHNASQTLLPITIHYRNESHVPF